MKAKKIIGATLVVLFSLFVIAGFSQKSSAQTDNSSSASTQGTTGYMGRGGMSGGMMNGGMMSGRMRNGRMMYGRMGRYMMGNYNAMRKLIDRVSSDPSTAKAEAGSAAVKSALADANAAITQLKQEYSQTWGMMRNIPMYANNCHGTQTQQKQN